jgi:hypothetical protein
MRSGPWVVSASSGATHLASTARDVADFSGRTRPSRLIYQLSWLVLNLSEYGAHHIEVKARTVGGDRSEGSVDLFVVRPPDDSAIAP